MRSQYQLAEPVGESPVLSRRLAVVVAAARRGIFISINTGFYSGFFFTCLFRSRRL